MNSSFSQSLRSLTDDLTKHKFFNIGSKDEPKISFMSFLEKETPKTLGNDLEERIMDFVVENKLFLEKLKNLKVHLKNENTKELDIISNVANLEKCLEEQVIPRLKISECTVKDVLQCLSENEDVFKLYQTISLDIYNITNYLHKDKEEIFCDKPCFQFIGEYFTKMLIFFEKLKQHENDETRNNIQRMITLMYQVVNIETQIKIRELVLKVKEEHLTYTEKCKTFLNVVIPIFNTKNKYTNNKNQILGKMSEIFQEELKMRKDLEICSCDYNHEEMANVLYKNSSLDSLYEEHVNLVKNRVIKMAFSQDYKLNCDTFSIIFNHLISLKTNFTKIMDLSKKYGTKVGKKKLFLDKLHKKLLKLDVIASTGSIIGLDFATLGDVLLRNIFSVKDNKDTFESVFFLFENCLVLTEEIILQSLSCYQSRLIIPISKIQFQSEDDHSLTFYINKKQVIVSSNSPHHGDLFKLREILMNLLLKEIYKLKKEHKET